MRQNASATAPNARSGSEGEAMRWPPAYALFVEQLWYLPPHQANTFWFALAHSTFLRPVKLRQYLGFLGHMPTDTARIAEEILSPAMVVACIEDLVTEG